MTDTAGLDDVVDLLWRARTSGCPVRVSGLGELTEPQAYAIQRRTADRLVASGDRRVGWKIGLTTPGAGGPIRGTLFASAVIGAGSSIMTAGLHDPRIEGEILFVVRDELRGPGVTPADVLAATRALGVAIEVFAGRVMPAPTRPAHMIADNSAAAYFIPGLLMLPADQVDLTSVRLRLSRGDEQLACGAPSTVMGGPARAVAWLTDNLAAEGEALRPGDLVLSGSATGAHPVQGGESWRLEAGVLGSITVAFT